MNKDLEYALARLYFNLEITQEYYMSGQASYDFIVVSKALEVLKMLMFKKVDIRWLLYLNKQFPKNIDAVLDCYNSQCKEQYDQLPLTKKECEYLLEVFYDKNESVSK